MIRNIKVLSDFFMIEKYQVKKIFQTTLENIIKKGILTLFNSPIKGGKVIALFTFSLFSQDTCHIQLHRRKMYILPEDMRNLKSL